jgi:hypothetical protein
MGSVNGARGHRFRCRPEGGTKAETSGNRRDHRDHDN